MTTETIPAVRREGQRPAGRPPLPKGAGINSLKLDLEVTRDELASHARRPVRDVQRPGADPVPPVFFTGLFLALTGAAAGIATLLLRRRGRAR